MRQSQAPRSQLRILIVEDHVLFAESLELVLSVEGYDVKRVPIPEHGFSSSAMLTTISRLKPRIVLLDLDLGDFGNGVRLIAPMARSGVHVVVVTASDDRARWGEALRYGARRVSSKSRPLNEILATVRRINHGLPVMDREERETLLALWHEQRSERQDVNTRLERLTAREREVLAHLMHGRSVHGIAALGVVSEATVRTQVKSILAKLEVSSQLAAVGLAHRVHWRGPAV